MCSVDFDESSDLLADATAVLLQTLSRLTDADARGPSLLPGWTRGHVITHLARNADGLARLAGSAVTSVPAVMYSSREVRVDDIEAGAGRPADELRADLASASQAFAEVLAVLTPQQRRHEVDNQGTVMAVEALPWLRLREVTLHLVDLDLGVGCEAIDTAVRSRLLAGLRSRPSFADAPPVELVATDTAGRWHVGPREQAGAPPTQASTAGDPLDHEVTVSGSEAQLLAWATGRSTGAGLSVDPAGPLPVLPGWG